MSDELNCRAITLQQPYAAAMAYGVCRFTRRGKVTRFAEGGEWIAIHCGMNDEHLKNREAMTAIRAIWPACPSDVELRAGMKHVLGFARFVQGDVPAASDGPKACSFMQQYTCSKPFMWRTDGG